MATASEHARAMSRVVGEVKLLMVASTLPSIQKDIAELVDTFNSLSLPRGYLYVDLDTKLVHLVHIIAGNGTLDGILRTRMQPAAIAHTVDVIWDYDPFAGTWRATKDRTGDFARVGTVHSTGIPKWKQHG